MGREQVDRNLRDLVSQNFRRNVEAQVALCRFRTMANALGYRGQFKQYHVANCKITDEPQDAETDRAPPAVNDKKQGDKKTDLPPVQQEVAELSQPEASLKAKKEKDKAKQKEKSTRRGPQPRSLKRDEKKLKDPKLPKSRAKRFKR